jgi:hypothetical protein
MAIIKELKSAIPTVDTISGNVISWFVEITLRDDNFERDYPYTIDTEDLNKTVNEFTKDELVGRMPYNLEDTFSHHKSFYDEESVNSVELIDDFNINSLD